MIDKLTKLVSFFSGKAAALPLPFFLRRPVFRNYSRIYGASLEEAQRPITEYLSLSEFFSRALRSGARPVEGPICSPADGKVSSMGKIENHSALQAKGKNYTVGELLLDGSLAAEFEGGTYFTVYLAPGDYHRVHSPVSGELKVVKHIPGALYPVSPTVASKRERLFSRNERICLLIENSDYGKVCVVFVGALNVGSMTLSHSKVVTNNTLGSVFFPPAPFAEYVSEKIEIGDELGQFHMGSTVVVLFTEELKLAAQIGDKVKMGQSILT
jgi:phosphatidylserine decarboxylase